MPSRATTAAILGVLTAALLVVGTYFGAWRGNGGHIVRYPGRIAVVDGCGVRHMFFDGKDQRSLCLPGIFAAVSLSWDGKTIAWDTQSGLVVGDMNVSNQSLTNQHIPPVPTGTNVEPSLSPDGQRIAFLHSARSNGRYDVWVGSTSIDNSEQLTTTHNVSTVAWSPRGDWIAFVRGWSEETLEGEIVLIHTDGTGARLLTRGDTPAWSPDGSRLVFFHKGGVWTIKRDGSDAHLLAANAHSPAWSRDGNLIAFMRQERCGKPVCPERVSVVPTAGGMPRAVGPTFPSSRRLLWLRDPYE